MRLDHSRSVSFADTVRREHGVRLGLSRKDAGISDQGVQSQFGIIIVSSWLYRGIWAYYRVCLDGAIESGLRRSLLADLYSRAICGIFTASACTLSRLG